MSRDASSQFRSTYVVDLAEPIWIRHGRLGLLAAGMFVVLTWGVGVWGRHPSRVGLCHHQFRLVDWWSRWHSDFSDSFVVAAGLAYVD